MAARAQRHVLRHDERVPGPWANGGGVTYEVVRSPAGADDFDWRLSVAEVATEGPFSAYPGVDRILVLLGGAMTLVINGEAYDVRPFAPVSFPGEASVVSLLPAGSTMDFNVMTRRGRAAAEVLMHFDADLFLTPEPNTDTVVFIADGAWRVDGVDEALSTWDCVTVENPIRLSGDGTLAIVTLRMRADSL